MGSVMQGQGTYMWAPHLPTGLSGWKVENQLLLNRVCV